MPSPVYLDHASAAPWIDSALEAYVGVAGELPADPARRHSAGRAARDLLERARGVVAEVVGGRSERVVFTSGGTEAVHLAVRGAAQANRLRPPRILSTAVEHSSVLAAADATGVEHVVLPVDAEGVLELGALEAALSDGGAALVNVQHANHEVGALQPLSDAVRLCRAHDALLHVDACQTVGRLPTQLIALGADFVSLSGAKFGGGRGIGALAWSERARFTAQLTGDEREGRRRSGLEHLPGAAALAEALLQLAPDDPDGRAAREAGDAHALRRQVRAAVAELSDVAVHGPEDESAPHIAAFSALYVEGDALVAELDRAGFAVHSGSSCATTSGEPSHVLVAMGALTHGHVRVSVGLGVTAADIDRFVAALERVLRDLRSSVGR